MEAILLVFGELAAPLVGVFMSTTCALLGPLAELVLKLLAGLFGKWFPARDPDAAPGAKILQPLRIPDAVWRGLRWLCGIVLVAAALGVFVADTFYFQANVQWIVDRVSKTTGTSIRYRAVDGSFWSGRLRFQDVELHRVVDTGLGFDLRTSEVELDLAMLAAFVGNKCFDRIEVRTVRGSFERRTPPDGTRSPRPFRVEHLTITDLRVDVVEGQGQLPSTRGTLELSKADFAPLRSEHLWFDVLFRSNLRGSFDGSEFEIRSRAEGEGRKTAWTVRRLRLAHARAFAPQLARYARDGFVDLDVDDSWSLADPIVIHSVWNVVLRDLTAPDDLASLTEVERRFVALLATRGARLPLRLRIDVRETDFDVGASVDAAPLITALGAVLLEELGVAVTLTPEDGKALLRAAGSLWKEALESWRARK